MKIGENNVQTAEFLVLPDGKILAHNITPAVAAILSELDPENEPMRQRATQTARQPIFDPRKHEHPTRN